MMQQAVERVDFRQWKDCTVSIAHYLTGSGIALLLTKGSERIATATVNLVDHKIDARDVAIKDYSENAGMLDALVAARIISPPFRYIVNGHVEIPVCRLTATIEAEAES